MYYFKLTQYNEIIISLKHDYYFYKIHKIQNINFCITNHSD